MLARKQTAGYGRRGREWRTGAGNFAGTLLFRPEGDPATFGQLSFVAGLAVIEALDAYAREDALTLKWPNDILADGAKLAGLLLERIDSGGHPMMALGVGVNLVSAPDDVGYPTARLADHLGSDRRTPTSEALAARLDEAFHNLLAVWKERGMETIRALWLERAAGVGETIRVRLPNEELTGVFAGLDASGALMLSQNGETRLVTAGEIMFGDDSREPL